MAKSKSTSINKSKQPKQTDRDYEAIGPSQDGFEGYGSDGVNPSNPSDALFQGAPLILRVPEAQVLTRPFKEATRSPLHYNDGPGTDEVVTSRRPVAMPLTGNAHAMLDHDELRPLPGVNKQPYASGSNTSKTLNGADIYGT